MWKLFDLRLVILVAINIVKSMPLKWDPFELINDLSWAKFFILTSLFFLFAFIFIRIEISLHSPNINLGSIVRVQVLKGFSPSLLTCFLACLFLPQFLFWYVCPVILVSFRCSSACISGFVFSVGAVLSVMPDLNITIAAASDGDDDQLHGSGEEEEANYVEEHV